jgi:hypothetical protein
MIDGIVEKKADTKNAKPYVEKKTGLTKTDTKKAKASHKK